MKKKNGCRAFTGVNVLVTEGEELHVLRGGTVTVENGLITGVGRELSVPARAETVDLGGKYLCPGLINLHVHMPGTGKASSQKIVTKPAGGGKSSALRERVMRSMENGAVHKVLLKLVSDSARAQLCSGVTTVRAVGDLFWSDVEVRDRINAGRLAGPRLLVSGVGVSVPGGHMAGMMAAACASPEEARAQVRKCVEHGVDWIKIFVTGGVLDASDDGSPARLRMSQEIADAACAAAHAAGLRVASHAESTEGVRVSLRAGVDTVEHGGAMDDEIVGLFRKNGASVTLTISPALAICELPEKLTGMNEIQRRCSAAALEGMITGAKQALERGIPVGLGTDASCPFVTQYDTWREVYYFAKYCEVTNAFALYTATQRNADILHLGDVTGSIAVGKSADMIVFARNPLDDLRALGSVEAVMSQGVYYDAPGLRRLKNIDAELDKLL